MTNSKKPKSKPAAKKKAVRKPQPPAPGRDLAYFADIADRVEQLAAKLEAANRKLDFVVVQLGFYDDQELYPIVTEALKTEGLKEWFSANGDGEGKGEQQ